MKRSAYRLLVVLIPAVILLGASHLGAETRYMMIPAASFAADGTDQYNYINYGDRLETETTLHFQTGVRLPNASVITSMDMMTRDDDSGTITVKFKRTKFGSDTGTETLLTFTSPGNMGCSTTGLCHDMESLLDIKVDSANYTYWFDVLVPDDTGTGTDLQLYGVRISYEVDDLIFADTFESTDTRMWSSESTAKALEVEHRQVPGSGAFPTEEKRIDEILSGLRVEDPEAREALEKALKRQDGFGSPLIIPGPAFKTTGYTEYDDYYFSESYGFIYARPNGDGDGALMTTGVNLPDGAEISFFMAFFVDTRRDNYIQGNIQFWFDRLDTVDRNSEIHMVYAESSGIEAGIRSLSVNRSAMEAVEPGCTTIDNSHYLYYVTVDVGPYDISPPDPYGDEEWWHKLYAIVFLYTMP